mgnify:CR=1 FL=1
MNQKTFNIAVSPGDGIGPEVSGAAQRVLDASGGAAVSCLGHQHPRVIEAMWRGDLTSVPMLQRFWLEPEGDDALLDAKRAHIADALSQWRAFLGVEEPAQEPEPPARNKFWPFPSALFPNTSKRFTNSTCFTKTWPKNSASKPTAAFRPSTPIRASFGRWRIWFVKS